MIRFKRFSKYHYTQWYGDVLNLSYAPANKQELLLIEIFNAMCSVLSCHVQPIYSTYRPPRFGQCKNQWTDANASVSPVGMRSRKIVLRVPPSPGIVARRPPGVPGRNLPSVCPPLGLGACAGNRQSSQSPVRNATGSIRRFQIFPGQPSGRLPPVRQTGRLVPRTYRTIRTRPRRPAFLPGFRSPLRQS